MLPLLNVVAPEGAPDTLYVATWGKDDNDGRSPDRPLATLQAADALAKPGWTVMVMPGEFVIPVQTSTRGEPDRPIIWRSAGLHAAKIKVAPADVVVWKNTASHVVIECFDISGGRVGIENTGNQVMIRRNKIHDVGHQCDSKGGCGIENAGLSSLIEENEFERIGLFEPTPCLTYSAIVTRSAVLAKNVVTSCSGVEVTWL